MTNPKYNHAEAFCHMKYQSEDKSKTVMVWNSRDGVTPFCFNHEDIMLQHIDWRNDKIDEFYQPKKGELIWITHTEETAKQAGIETLENFKNHGHTPEGGEEKWLADFIKDTIDNKQPHLLIVDKNWGQKAFPTDAAKMRQVGEVLKKELPDKGWALLVFDFGKEGMSNYISNAQRQDMIKALEETLHRFKNQQDIKTPENN